MSVSCCACAAAAVAAADGGGGGGDGGAGYGACGVDEKMGVSWFIEGRMMKIWGVG